MYTTLLGSALEQRDRADDSPGIGDLFAQLLTCRAQLAERGIMSPNQAKTLGHVTSLLNYDVSLISLVRIFGVEFAINQFDNGERHLLEQALIDRGIPLDRLDEQVHLDGTAQ